MEPPDFYFSKVRRLLYTRRSYAAQTQKRFPRFDRPFKRVLYFLN
jgi:hypothetical protein